MENSDQVLALRRGDACLAADRGGDLGEKRRRHLPAAYAAAQDSGGESGEVADDAAAESDDGVAAFDPHLEQAFGERSERREALRRLARREHDRAYEPPFGPEARLERRPMGARDGFVR